MPVQKPQSMVPSGVSRRVSLGAACTAGIADTAVLRARASERIVIFIMTVWRMLLFGVVVFKRFQVIKKSSGD